MQTGTIDLDMEVIVRDGKLIDKSILTNRAANQKKTIRHCLVCGEAFETTVGGPHICKKMHCQKVLSKYNSKVYSVTDPDACLSSMPKEISSAEQQDLELRKTPIPEIKFVLKENTPRKTEIRLEVVKFLAKREQIKKGGLQ